MTLLEQLSLVVLLVVAAVGVVVLVAILKHAPRSAAGSMVGGGDFAGAFEVADTGDDADRDELMAAVIAAKHLLRLDDAGALARRIVGDDGDDGEAWMELGLIAAYRGDYAEAGRSLARAARCRSDLFESISLHRAWAELKAGQAAAARQRFEEIAAPLESKLRSDLGPGDPLFAEWFFQAADLWEENGVSDKAEWARREARRAAPESPLVASFT